jgi:hypothetical protein
MSLIIIVTTKSASAGKTASFKPLRVKIGLPVRSVDEIKKFGKKPKSCNFTIKTLILFVWQPHGWKKNNTYTKYKKQNYKIPSSIKTLNITLKAPIDADSQT